MSHDPTPPTSPLRRLAVTTLCVVVCWASTLTLAPCRALASSPDHAESLAGSDPADTALPGWGLVQPQLGDSLRSSADRPHLHLAEGTVAGTTTIGLDPLLSARARLKSGRQAIGVGVTWLICGPLLIGLGTLGLFSLSTIAMGVLSMATGGLWLVLSIPLIIAGAIEARKAKKEIRRLEHAALEAPLHPAASAVTLVRVSW